MLLQELDDALAEVAAAVEEQASGSTDSPHRGAAVALNTLLEGYQADGLDPHVVIIASFPLGLSGAQTAAAKSPSVDADCNTAGCQGKTEGLPSLCDLPAAAAVDWKLPLEDLVRGSGRACVPVLTATAHTLRVAVCPQVRLGRRGRGFPSPSSDMRLPLTSASYPLFCSFLSPRILRLLRIGCHFSP